MKKLLAILLLACVPAGADLLDRIKVEDTIQARIQDTYRMYDERARVFVTFEYRKFEGVLPGTTLESGKDLLPKHVDASDILRLKVEIFSALEELPPAAKELVYRAVPLPKERVQISIKALKSPATPSARSVAPSLDPESFANTLETTVRTWAVVFSGAAAIFLIGLLAFLFYQNQLRMREFRAQIGQLVTTLSELSLGNAPTTTATVPSVAPQAATSSEENPIAKMSTPAWVELMADCYWCSEDSYAVWLWRKASPERRKDLIEALPFMKEYSQFVMDLQPREAGYHDHPVYLEPAGWSETSQEDLAALVRENGSLWHSVSPLRQRSLPLSLEEKLRFLQLEPSKPAVKSRKPSAPRALAAKLAWGEIAAEDESAIFRQPEIVPGQLRVHIKSLVWLARKDSAFIEKTLARFDARALASAWVGPQEVLETLEKSLPEKKRKMLQTYLLKAPPSRQAPAYLALVDEGTKNEAA